jgi:hypothetical protein
MASMRGQFRHFQSMALPAIISIAVCVMYARLIMPLISRR